MADTSNFDQEPRSLVEAVRYFSDPDRALGFVQRARWADGVPVCPYCGHREQTFVRTRRIWKCKNPSCRRQWSAKVGTIFEDSPLGWDKWLPAVWLIANSKNSISSHELARALGVTQKTAWFMLHRIRDAMETGTFQKVRGPVEVDETYVGGKAKNMHKRVREIKIYGRGNVGKTAVQGARKRDGGTVHAEVVGPSHRQLGTNVEKWVAPGEVVYTDDAKAYRQLGQTFAHDTVVHDHEYVRGPVHINGIENFWSLLKRAIKGTQVHIAPEHLHRYVTERTFAYNYRDRTDLGRMRLALGNVEGRRLTWAELTAHS